MTWETQNMPEEDNGWTWVVNELKTAASDIQRGLNKLQSVIEELSVQPAETPKPEGTVVDTWQQAITEQPAPPAAPETGWMPVEARENVEPVVAHNDAFSPPQPSFEPAPAEQPTPWVAERPIDAEPADADPVRDEVRRMVEQTRAEIMSNPFAAFAKDGEDDPPARPEGFAVLDGASWIQPKPAEQPQEPERQPEPEPSVAIWRETGIESPNAWANQQAEAGYEESSHPISHSAPMQPWDVPTPSLSAVEPPTEVEQTIAERIASVAPHIMIEDPSGRVELVRVYQALARLGRASDANLANYTPHSVTVILESGNAPTNADLGAAIEDAFGRACQVSLDQAGRIVVRLLDQNARVA